MPYSDLIMQESEYTYSANIQFDIENDRKLLRFIPNDTTTALLKEYFTDITRQNPENHARILYGSYGTGKSHFLTVLSLLLSKSHTDGFAFETFTDRLSRYDAGLASDIASFVHNPARKPFLVVPIVFDFEDFDRCIYFSLKKKLDGLDIPVQFKTFYDQATQLIEQWKSAADSKKRLEEACNAAKIKLPTLEAQLHRYDKRAEKRFQRLFSVMTYGVTYVYEISNLSEAIKQANMAISKEYCGIIFIFDEFGRYIEDNIKSVKVKSIQDLAETAACFARSSGSSYRHAGNEHIVPHQCPADRLDLPRVQLLQGLPGLQAFSGQRSCRLPGQGAGIHHAAGKEHTSFHTDDAPGEQQIGKLPIVQAAQRDLVNVHRCLHAVFFAGIIHPARRMRIDIPAAVKCPIRECPLRENILFRQTVFRLHPAALPFAGDRADPVERIAVRVKFPAVFHIVPDTEHQPPQLQCNILCVRDRI